jgi:hypothetical protein
MIIRWDQVGELDFGHGSHAQQRCPDAESHDGRFGDRCVKDTRRAKALSQSFRNPKHTTVLRHILAKDEDACVARHLLDQRLAQRLVIA